MAEGDTPEGKPATFGQVFASHEFTGLWLATILSVIGDQFARVALGLLVFDRTGSALLTAAVYAVTFVPDLVGGSLLAGWADRFPRRRVMVNMDLLRAGLVGLMAVPGMSIALLIALVFLVQMFSVPFTAARISTTRTILEGDRFTVGTGVMTTTYQVGLVAGYPLGALVVNWLGTTGALLADAVTFGLSAVVISAVVADRPATARDAVTGSTTVWGSMRNGVRVVRADRKLTALLALACVSGLYIAPSGLVVPYADEIGAGALGVGLLLAVNPLGTAVGMVVLSRFVAPAWRLRLLGPLAVATCVWLLPTGLAPALAWSMMWWGLAGLCRAHDMITNTTYASTVPDEVRGQAMGLAIAGLRGAQGVGVLLTGALAEVFSPSRVIAVSAGLGVVAAWLAARAWHRAAAPATDMA